MTPHVKLTVTDRNGRKCVVDWLALGACGRLLAGGT